MRGVPQESVLGPLLFIIYMNDLPNVINSHLHLFADDIAMYTSGTDPAIVQHKLNSDLASLFEWVTSNGFTVNVSKCQSLFLARRHRASLFEWVTSNGFTVNVSKCQSLFLARRHRRHQLSTIRLLLDNNLIQPQRSIRYLGVIVDEYLNWSDHVRSVRRRSLAALAAIRKVSMCVI